MSADRRAFGVRIGGLLLAAGALHISGQSATAMQPLENDEPDDLRYEAHDFVDVVAPVAVESAAAIGERITARLAANASEKPLRIAVFSFGNAEGKITKADHAASFNAQGAFTQALAKALAQRYRGKFVLLDKFGLARELSEGGVDLSAISAANADLPATLERLNIGAAVLGQVLVKDTGNVVAPRIVFASSGGSPQAIVTPRPSDGAFEDTSNYTAPLSKQLGIQIWLRSGKTWAAAPIVTTKDEQSEEMGVMYAVLPAGAEGNEISIRLWNLGAPPQRDYLSDGPFEVGIGWTNENANLDRQRLIGCALSLDGVNSFYQDLGDGETKAVCVHPRNAMKWILTPPNYRIVAANNAAGYTLSATRDVGQSVLDVAGFQVDGRRARAFVLGAPSQSVAAEKVGITDEIGVITAVFYAQKFPGDQQSYAAAAGGEPKLGIAAGRQIYQPVQKINVEWHKEPVRTLRIFYCSAADCPVPPQERVALNGR